MTWAAAIRWALIRALDTGLKHRVVAYRSPGSGEWRYLARRTPIAWGLAGIDDRRPVWCGAKPVASVRVCELDAGHAGDHFTTLRYGSTLTWARE